MPRTGIPTLYNSVDWFVPLVWNVRWADVTIPCCTMCIIAIYNTNAVLNKMYHFSVISRLLFSILVFGTILQYDMLWVVVITFFSWTFWGKNPSMCTHTRTCTSTKIVHIEWEDCMCDRFQLPCHVGSRTQSSEDTCYEWPL